MRESVMPAIFVQRTVFYLTYRIFPVISGFQICAFDYTTTGKTKNTGIKIGQGLSQVFAQSVFPVHPGLFGEEGNMLQVKGSLATGIKENAQQSLGFSPGGRDFHLIFLPFFGIDAQISSVHHIVLSINKLYAYTLGSAIHRSGPNRKTIGGTFFESYATETFVFESGMFVGMSRGRQTYIMRITLERSFNGT